ncbi:MAG: endopeptidase La [Chloroflexota bacterium]|nr:endopeptidase La [Chloroflexota bacterium]
MTEQETPVRPEGSQPPGESEQIIVVPSVLPILPTGEGIVFPAMVFPMVVKDERSVRLVSDAANEHRMMGLFSQKNPEGPETADNLNEYGTAATILRLLHPPDGTLQLIVRGTARISLLDIVETEPYLRARVEELPEVTVETTEVEALQRNLLSLFQRIVTLSPALPQEASTAAADISEPGRLSDFIASALDLPQSTKLELLALTDVTARLRRVTELATREEEVLELGSEIQGRIRGEMEKTQREFYLREQLKQVQRELGEITGEQTEVEELRRRIEETKLPEAAQKQAGEELSRLERIPPASPEYGIIRTYLDWIITLPWSKSTDDNLDLRAAKEILDEDHYDLEKVKERVLEYLAVHKLRGEVKGPILCFVGPPGVGKTSLGQSIGRALNRKFIRISLGGVRDEAEIRGHRRTYIGAMPGRIIQGLRRVETNNPVFMLDEIDKLAVGFQGDPAAALLEVLDPAQNSNFSDHYLDIPFDLSKVLFVATANMLDTIPPPLRDRLEIIELAGYTEGEKLHIARRYLVPRQIAENGLTDQQIEFSDAALHRIIADYTREAGVRSLERQIGTIARKVAREVVSGEAQQVVVDEAKIATYLGPVRFLREVIEEGDEIGVVTGLAWTPVGGDVLFVEASKMPGHGNLILTGQLGDVMQESARAAMSYVRSRAKDLGLADNFYSKLDFHVHVPAGAIPKDGPSAGVTITTALISALTGRKVNKEVAMTGEVTLRGRVLPIGGIKEKTLAAHRAGVKTVILPKENERDIPDIPQEVRDELTFILADHMDDVLQNALEAPPAALKRSPRGSSKGEKEPMVAAGGQ